MNHSELRVPSQARHRSHLCRHLARLLELLLQGGFEFGCNSTADLRLPTSRELDCFPLVPPLTTLMLHTVQLAPVINLAYYPHVPGREVPSNASVNRAYSGLNSTSEPTVTPHSQRSRSELTEDPLLPALRSSSTESESPSPDERDHALDDVAWSTSR